LCEGEQEVAVDLDKSREFWAKVAKENGWYAEPFFVQVWADPDTKEVRDSVSTRTLTEDVVVWLKNELCSYCGDENVFEEYQESCWQCVFTCERCEQTTPYEKGMAYDELCDDCGVLVGSTPENPWKGE
jgi:hypothetical protein